VDSSSVSVVLDRSADSEPPDVPELVEELDDEADAVADFEALDEVDAEADASGLADLCAPEADFVFGDARIFREETTSAVRLCGRGEASATVPPTSTPQTAKDPAIQASRRLRPGRRSLW
jgi:hypothetical protein